MSNLKHVSDDEEFNAIIKSVGNDLVVFDFFTSWCGPCRQMEPVIESLAMKFPNILFLKVDADKCFDVAMKYDVKAVPKFVLYMNQSIFEEIQGAQPVELDQKVQQMEREFRKLNPIGSTVPLEEQSSHLSQVVSSIGKIEDVTKYLDKEGCVCLNDLTPSSFSGFLNGKKLISGKGTGKLVLVYTFTEKLMLHSFKIKARQDTGPKVLRLFANHPKLLDFSIGTQLAPSMEVTLSPEDLNGERAIELRAGSFKLVSNLQIFVTEGMHKTAGHNRVEIENMTIFGAPVTMNASKKPSAAGPSTSMQGKIELLEEDAAANKSSAEQQYFVEEDIQERQPSDDEIIFSRVTYVEDVTGMLPASGKNEVTIIDPHNSLVLDTVALATEQEQHTQNQQILPTIDNDNKELQKQTPGTKKSKKGTGKGKKNSKSIKKGSTGKNK